MTAAKRTYSGQDVEQGGSEENSSHLGATACGERCRVIDPRVLERYDVYRLHLVMLLRFGCRIPEALNQRALLEFRITTRILVPREVTSRSIPKVPNVLRPKGWIEARIRGLVVRMIFKHEKHEEGKSLVLEEVSSMVIKSIMSKVVLLFDLEWNSLDERSIRIFLAGIP